MAATLRAESERVAVHDDLNVHEAGLLQTRGKAPGVDWHQHIAQVEESKEHARPRIGADEDASWAEDACDFGQEAILQGRRWHMVEHGQTDDAVECGVGDGRHRGRIFAEKSDVLAGCPPRQVISERPIDFDAGQMINASAEEIGRDAGPGTEFKNVRAKFDALENPRQDTDFDGRFPIGGTAQPAMNPVHGAFASLAP